MMEANEFIEAEPLPAHVTRIPLWALEVLVLFVLLPAAAGYANYLYKHTVGFNKAAGDGGLLLYDWQVMDLQGVGMHASVPNLKGDQDFRCASAFGKYRNGPCVGVKTGFWYRNINDAMADVIAARGPHSVPIARKEQQ